MPLLLLLFGMLGLPTFRNSASSSANSEVSKIAEPEDRTVGDAAEVVEDNGHSSDETEIAPEVPAGTHSDEQEDDADVADTSHGQSNEGIHDEPEVHSHSTDSALAGEHMAAMELVPRGEATDVAISNGDWFDPNIWSNGEVPGPDAKVLIPDGVNVSYGAVSDTSLFTVRIDGHLEFATDTDSQIVFDTMVVSPTGHLIIGTESDPVDANVNVDLIVANNGKIDVSWDPQLLSRGLISHGEATIHGAQKDSHEKVVNDPMEGDTSIKFDEVPDGWQVGDTLVIAGTHYDGYKWGGNGVGNTHFLPEDEIRIISGIDSNGRIHFDEPLVHDHDAPRDDLKTSVANYTRNVSIETENGAEAEIYERGHVMFMHSDDVDVRYVEFHELGRTDKSIESKNVDDFASVKFDTNVQGRYSAHLHRTGVDDQENPAVLEGNAVFGSPGWGFVHHDSNAVLSNNASYDTFGAGFVAETGNETGVWEDNIAIYAKGVSWADPKNVVDISNGAFDTAKGGHGFWFQGRLVGSEDNIAASVNTGFVYFHRSGGSSIDFDADLFAFPEAVYYDDEIRAGKVPILSFESNEVFAAKEGLHVVKANPNQGSDIWSHFDGFTAWSVKNGVQIEYTSHYILEDFDLIGKEDTQFSSAETGITTGNNTSEIVIIDSEIEGFSIGVDFDKKFTSNTPGTPDLHDYVAVNVTISDVEDEYANFDPDLDRILTAADLTSQPTKLTLDGPLVYNNNGVSISGTKTDALGTTDFPGGTDNFDLTKEDLQRVVEKQGFWTDESGQKFTPLNIYFTDRVTGKIYSVRSSIRFD